MPSAHTLLRELVAHLSRAQRAFDGGRLDEAERALDAALALDPRNVQAADLRHRIARERERSQARVWQGGAARRDPVRSHGDGLSGGSSPAAWSAFEQRIRERRADRAVADARLAKLRGDRDAALRAAAELDAVAPGDARRAAIEEWLGHESAQPAVQAAGTAGLHGDATDVAMPRAAADVTPASPTFAGEMSLERDLAADPANTATPGRDGGAIPRRRTRSRLAIVACLVAAAALIGVWMSGDAGRLNHLVAPAEHTNATRSSTPPVATIGTLQDGAGAPPLLPGSPEVAAAPDRLGTDVAPPTPAVRTTEPEEPAARMADVRVSAPDRGAAPSGGTAVTGGRNPERTEPSAPLDALVEAPIVPPEVFRSSQPQATRAMAPLKVPPVSAPASPAAATVAPAPGVPSRAVADTGAIRDVVDIYADAFSALDASATQRVWPGADLRGLRRAFDQLSAQTITFNRCDVDAMGEVAQAVCTGRQEWVPKVGDRSPRSEERTWRFALGRDGGDWVIDSVQVQR